MTPIAPATADAAAVLADPGDVTAGRRFRACTSRVFDLDGTLVDTLPGLTQALNQALADLQLPRVDASLVRDSLHGGLEGSADAALAGLQVDTARRSALIQHYRDCYDQQMDRESRLYPGVRELLEHVHRRGHRMAVCTNKLQTQACRLLQRHGLLPLFEAVIGADSCAWRKPHPQPLRLAMQAIDGRAETTVLVGDSHVDVACAAAAGVDCLIFTGGYGGYGGTAVQAVASACTFTHHDSLRAALSDDA
jgi:phosphoglycolate phosphatase